MGTSQPPKIRRDRPSREERLAQQLRENLRRRKAAQKTGQKTGEVD